MAKKKIDLEKLKVIDAQYNHDNFFEWDKHRQEIYTSIKRGYIIDIDLLEPRHVQLFLDMCEDFFTNLGETHIIFQSMKGRLRKVREWADSRRLRYKKLGNKHKIHVGRVSG